MRALCASAIFQLSLFFCFFANRGFFGVFTSQFQLTSWNCPTKHDRGQRSPVQVRPGPSIKQPLLLRKHNLIPCCACQTSSAWKFTWRPSATTEGSSYLEPSRNRMQKPTEGVDPQRFLQNYRKELNKEATVFSEH